MSWTAEPPFPTEGMRRRSRSRSPDRRPYERFVDRDSVREREWADYERERAEWEYRRANPMGPRGRSRSPGAYDDRRPKRRRSLSPPYVYERERYDPRPRYDDYYDPRGPPPPGRYSPPPPRGGYRQYSPPRPRLTDPYDMDYPATLRYFSDWYRVSHPGSAAEDEAQVKSGSELDASGSPVNPMKKRYTEYRRFITNRQVQILFDHHKGSTWFRERYGLEPQYADLRTRVRKNGLKGTINEFIQNLQQGKYDPLLELDSTSPSAVNNSASVSYENGGDTAKEDHQDPDVAGMIDEQRADDDLDINMFDQEVNGEGGGNENALTTPAPVNGSARVPGGASTSAEEVSAAPEGVQIMIRTIPPDIGRVKIEEVCSKIPGFMYLALGDPMQKRNYYRCGWIRFADDVDVTEVVAKLADAKIDGFRMQVSHSTRPFTSRCRVTPTIASSPERVQADLQNVRKLVTTFEEEADRLAGTPIDGSDDVGESEMSEQKDRGTIAVEARAKELFDQMVVKLEGADEGKAEAKKNLVILDLYLAYLRHAFHCCYYCAAVAYHDEELLRKCIKHVRGSPWNSGDPKEERWVEWLTSKVALLTDRENVDPTQYGGKDYQKELSRACEPHLTREDEGKFRCGVCTKRFKAYSFVEKHIANKHPELVTNLAEIPFFNSFALDPHRIQPFTHPPPQSGNQQPPLAAYGLRNGGGGGLGPRDMVPNGAIGGYRDIPVHHQAYPHYTYPPPMPPPMPMGGYYGEYNPQPYAPSGRYSPPGSRRRLSERVGERMADSPMTMTGGEGLPAKPLGFPELDTERGARESGPLPPPSKVKEDPRAAQGRKVSYMDMDEVAEGDVELSY
ncbi:hypothetical protein FRB94_004889 [Tulasnella sp. JGI-2019a]|nr:hypothetical protein FRB93_005824 [Tulasnella sp. JGI-2019a]KAG9001236.1 hypothetical protein FRB94_004889 [Tulasnella sp. JGI-2019a]KAG9024267.1 hypothetical protein FRB95_011725 [Tulasnella sp. JGI-2019a]